jgi:hypothetical protein
MPGFQAFQEIRPFQGVVQLSSANGINPVTLIVNQNVVYRLDAVFLCNNDTVPHVVNFFAPGQGTTTWASISVPAGAGFGGVAAVELISSLPTAVQAAIVFPINSGWSVGLEVALAAGKLVGITYFGGIFS